MKMEGLLGTSFFDIFVGGNFQHAMFDYQRIAVFSRKLYSSLYTSAYFCVFSTKISGH